MKLLFLLLVLFTLLGCQNSVEEDNQESENDNTADEETVNQTEQTDEESNHEDNQDDKQSTEDNENINTNSEAASDEGNESISSEGGQTSDTHFDVNSETVQQELFNLDQTEDSLSFSQDVITEGMTQTEVENLYGEYDLIYPGHGIPIIIYGNLGVRYSESFTDEAEEENVNPDENTVEDVFYFADTPYDEVISALGEPDTDVYETTEGPVGGILLMEYFLEEGDNSTFKGQFNLHEDDNGELIVDLFQIIEEPNDGEMLEPEDNQEYEVSELDVERMTFFIETYIDSLMNYYNNGDSDQLLTMTREESPNFWSLEENQESGNFSDHETYNIEILDVEKTRSGFLVTVEREYSHASSNGRETTEVVYNIIDSSQGFRVYDYEEEITE